MKADRSENASDRPLPSHLRCLLEARAHETQSKTSSSLKGPVFLAPGGTSALFLSVSSILGTQKEPGDEAMYLGNPDLVPNAAGSLAVSRVWIQGRQTRLCRIVVYERPRSFRRAVQRRRGCVRHSWWATLISGRMVTSTAFVPTHWYDACGDRTVYSRFNKWRRFGEGTQKKSLLQPAHNL